MNDYKQLCEQTCALADSVADFIRGELGKVEKQSIEYKSLNNLVSYVDKAAEQQLVEGLSRLLPEAKFIAEEGTISKAQGDWQWIVDPLDGTTNFLHQLPFFAISIGLRHKQKMVIGVVYEVVRGECFYSWGEQKVWLNGNPIQCSSTTNLRDSLLATGFPYDSFDRMQPYLKTLSHLMRWTRGLRRFGSAALDLAYVAAGRFDGFFEYSLAPWDVAAGSFLVEQAGGKVTDFRGGSNFLFGKEILATNMPIHDQLHNLLRSNF